MRALALAGVLVASGAAAAPGTPGAPAASAAPGTPAAPAASAASAAPSAPSARVGIAPGHFVALSYHEVDDARRDAAGYAPARYAVQTAQLVAHFEWLRANGYRPVSLDDIVAAHEGRRALPANAVLLTFDDGYADFHARVFPLLKLFGYPAVIALVGRWMDTPAGEPVDVDGTAVPRERFMSWEQVREVVASGLVEVASHTHDLHRGIAGNPQGNRQPAAVTRAWDTARARYEDDDAWRARVRDDLARSASRIARETGRAPRAIAWPYGRYNREAQSIAAALGMPIAMTLDDGPTAAAGPLDAVRRTIVEFAPDIADFQQSFVRGAPHPLERIVHVDLDRIWDADPAQQERNLSALLDRIVALRPTDVWLQAYADPDGDGEADATYFPNRHLPMRGDLFNRAAWQLATRAGVRVHAWMPVLAWRLPAGHPAAGDVVRPASGAAGASYRRLSPFSPRVRQAITELYEDLARHASFAGLLFHDDALIGDTEDASVEALATYRTWGLPADIDAIRADETLAQRWSVAKTRYLVDFTVELQRAVTRFRAPMRTARNLYARPVLDARAERWTAQSLAAFVDAYDRVGLMAMPMLEGVNDRGRATDRFLDALVAQVARTPGALDKTVFELQAADWRARAPVPDASLARWVRRLELAGARHLGYYPDDPHGDRPALRTIVPAFSARAVPEP